MRFIKDFIYHDEAATAVEYAVMLALILMSIIATVQSFGGTASSLFGNASSEIESHFN